MNKFPVFKYKTELRPNEKIPVFRETQNYLHFQVKPRIFFRFSLKYIILMFVSKIIK